MKRTHSYILILCLVVFVASSAAPSLSGDLYAPETPFQTSAQPSNIESVDALWSSELISELGIGPSVGSPSSRGQGITVGVVDTGVDGSSMSSGSLLDWIDLTGEGDVRLSSPVSPSSSGAVTVGELTAQVKGIPSKSGRVRIGEFRITDLPVDAPLREAVGAGFKVLVVATDRYIAGQYDTVYLDTDCDGSVVSERGLEVFRNSRTGVLVSLPSGRYLHVVLTDILDNGTRIVLGFDGHGHGTQVASVLLGSATGFTALVPGAKLISVKSVDSSGRTTWSLLAQGILAACRKGAKIVIMSVAPLLSGESDDSFEDAIRKAEREYGALVVIAAGNKGPGLGTLADYAELPNVLSVGAYIPRSMGQALGLTPGRMWPWSSIGPTSGGATVSLVAPAIGPAQVPGWAADRSTTWLFEGTSCATAYAGGAAAAVASALRSSGTPLSPVVLKESLEDGAVALPGVSPVEQGTGVLNADNAMAILKSGRKYSRVRTVAEWGGRYQTSGFFDRDKTPGLIPIGLDSFMPFDVSLRLDVPIWARANTLSLHIPAVEQREMALLLEPGLPLGLASGFVTGDDPSMPGIEMRALATALVPRRFGASGTLTVQHIMSPGMLHREYLRVNPGVESLSITLEVPKGGDGRPRGRERLYVYDDKGWLVHEGPWVGAGTASVKDATTVRLPAPGVWEIVVVSDPSSHIFGVLEALFHLTFTRRGLTATESHCSLVVSQDESAPVVGEVPFVNPGVEFLCRPMVIEQGRNGRVSSERLLASSSVSMPKSVTGVTEGTRYLYLGISEVSDPAADIDVYLYYLDPDANRWIEVKSSAKPKTSDEELTLVNPAPGQYIAYIEVRGLQDSQATFKWTTVIAREQARYGASEASAGSKEFAWPTGSRKSIKVSIPNRFSPGQENEVYLALWDETTGTLRSLVALDVTGLSPSVLTYAGTGSAANGRTAVTLSAWDSVSLKPVDALVRLGDVWFQLRNGKATVVINESSLEGLELYSEYPGMYPRMKTIHE